MLGAPPNEWLSVWDPRSMLRIPRTGQRLVIPSRSRSLFDLKRRRDFDADNDWVYDVRRCCCWVATSCVDGSSSILEKLVFETVDILFSLRRTPRKIADVQLCRWRPPSTLLLGDFSLLSKPNFPKSCDSLPFFDDGDGDPATLWKFVDLSSLYFSTCRRS